MCGIGGIVGWKGAPDGLEEALRRMRSALEHRGPDDQGLWLSADGTAGMCHRRLAILGLGMEGRQPMVRGSRVLVFNGEIYNFRELRARLEDKGFRFESRTDTEVLLRSLEEDGRDGLLSLSGMFAFGFYDETTKVLLLARDPFGIKPLYFAEFGGTLVFSSEIRALLATGLIPRKASANGLETFLRFGSVQEPLTAVDGVCMVPSGGWRIWSDGKPTAASQYWRPDWAEGRQDSRSAVLKRVRQATCESVARHLVSDLPVGLFLSGGIDSGVIAAASHAGDAHLQAFSISFEEKAYDESRSAQRTARAFGHQYREWKVSASEALEGFLGYLDAIDQPSVDGFNTYLACRFARSEGAKVVLSGLGGDELFGGYPSFQRLPIWMRRGRLAGAGSAWGRLAGWGLQILPNARVRRLGQWMEGAPDATNTYEMFRSIFTRREALAVLSQLGLEPDESEEDDPEILPGEKNQASYLELTRYMRNQLLRDSDVMSMAHGLELRVPFVDRELFGEISAVDAALRLESGKALLVGAFEELPSEVKRGPKRGFALPVSRWLQDEWEGEFDDWEKDAPVPLCNWQRRWCLFVLREWLQRAGIKGS